MAASQDSMYCSRGDMGAGSEASAATIVGTWRCGEMRGDAGRCREMRGDAGRCGEMRGDAGRCREMRGDAGRCGEMQGRVRVGGGGGAHELLGRYGEIS